MDEDKVAASMRAKLSYITNEFTHALASAVRTHVFTIAVSQCGADDAKAMVKADRASAEVVRDMRTVVERVVQTTVVSEIDAMTRAMQTLGSEILALNAELWELRDHVCMLTCSHSEAACHERLSYANRRDGLNNLFDVLRKQLGKE